MTEISYVTSEPLPSELNGQLSGLSQSQRSFPALQANYVSVKGYDNQLIMQLCQKMAQLLPGMKNLLPAGPEQQAAWLEYVDVLEVVIKAKAQISNHSESAIAAVDSENNLASLVQQKFNSRNTPEQLDPADIAPHRQLFLTFLSLLKHPQRQFDDITQRHMDFYYQQVLKFNAKAAVAQQVFVCFELAEGVLHHNLAKGCQLLAQPQPVTSNLQVLLPGEEPEKAPENSSTQYVLDHTIAVNQAKITQVRTIAAKSAQVITVFDQDEGAELDYFKVNIPNPIESDITKKVTYTINTLFLSSPLLLCKQGKREFILTASIDSAEITEATFKYFSVYISTTMGWTEVHKQDYDETLATPCWKINENKLTITLSPMCPAVVPPSIVPPGDSLAFTNPVIKFVPIGVAGTYPINVNELTLTVKVTGLTDIGFTNDAGDFNNDTSFNLFGEEPSKGASLYIENTELLSKPLTSLTLNINWVPGALENTDWEDGGSGIPAIDDIYKNYYIDDDGGDGGDGGGGEKKIIEELYTKATPQKNYLDEFQVFLSAVGYNGQIQQIKDANPTKLFQQKITWAFTDDTSFQLNPKALKLTLTNGDFLYPQYLISQNIQAQQLAQYNIELYLKALKEAPLDDVIENIKALSAAIIYPPYTPTTRPISLDYTTTALEVDLHYLNVLGQLQDKAVNAPIIHLQPASASILLEISPLLQEQTVSILMYIAHQGQSEEQVLAGTEPSLMDIQWQYWQPKNNTINNAGVWAELTTECEHRRDFEGSCLLTFSKPAVLLEDTIWLKINGIQTGDTANPGIIYLRTQAALATQVIEPDAYYDPHAAAQTLAPNQIHAFVQPQPNIGKVTQPFFGFGGLKAQSHTQLAVAASERLSNRARAITPSDYESLILAEFPQIQHVICRRASDQNPGVTINIIPKVQRLFGSSSSYPLADRQLRKAVNQFIQARCSKAVKLTVTSDRSY